MENQKKKKKFNARKSKIKVFWASTELPHTPEGGKKRKKKKEEALFSFHASF